MSASYRPPWWDPSVGTYGPRTDGAYSEAWKRYHMRGFWDASQATGLAAREDAREEYAIWLESGGYTLLSPRERRAVELVVVAQVAVESAAKAMGSSVNAVKVYLHRARCKRREEA